MFWSTCCLLLSAAWRGEAERSARGRGPAPRVSASSAADATGQCNSFLSLLPRYALSPSPFSRLPPSLPAHAAGSGLPCKGRGLPAKVASRPESSNQSFQTSLGSGTGSIRRWKVGLQTASGWGAGGCRSLPGRAPPHLPGRLGPRWGQRWSRPRPSTPRSITPSLRGCARVYSRRGSKPRGAGAPGECDSKGQRFPAPQSRGVPGRLGAQGGAPAPRPLARLEEGLEGLPDRSKRSFWPLTGRFGAVRNSGWPAFSGPSQHPHPHPEDRACAFGQAGLGTVATGARAWAGGRAREPSAPSGRRAFLIGSSHSGGDGGLEPRPAGAPALLEPCWGRQLPLARLLDVGSGQAPHPCSPHGTPRKCILYNIPMTFRGELESICRVEMGPGGGK